jgi:hypothetical protein
MVAYKYAILHILHVQMCLCILKACSASLRPCCSDELLFAVVVLLRRCCLLQGRQLYTAYLRCCDCDRALALDFVAAPFKNNHFFKDAYA